MDNCEKKTLVLTDFVIVKEEHGRFPVAVNTALHCIDHVVKCRLYLAVVASLFVTRPICLLLALVYLPTNFIADVTRCLRNYAGPIWRDFCSIVSSFSLL